MRNHRSLFTHVYECKVFARIVCGSRVQRVSRVQWDLACVSRKGSERRAAPACAREGVSTLGELPFKAGNNGMRVAVLPSPHGVSQRRPYKRKRRRWRFLSLFRLARLFCKYIKKGSSGARRRASRRLSLRLRSTFRKY